MAIDLSDHNCVGNISGEENSVSVLARRCFIAQPVTLGKKCAPVLRFAIGALQVTEACASNSEIDGILAHLRVDDVAAMKKLLILLTDWSLWSTATAVQSLVNRAKTIFRLEDEDLTGSFPVAIFRDLLHTLGVQSPD